MAEYEVHVVDAIAMSDPTPQAPNDIEVIGHLIRLAMFDVAREQDKQESGNA